MCNYNGYCGFNWSSLIKLARFACNLVITELSKGVDQALVVIIFELIIARTLNSWVQSTHKTLILKSFSTSLICGVIGSQITEKALSYSNLCLFIKTFTCDNSMISIFKIIAFVIRFVCLNRLITLLSKSNLINTELS